MARIRLTSEAIGSLYSVARRDWDAIANRVRLVLSAKAIAALIAETIPPFPALVAQCELWQSSTFPRIVMRSADLAGWAARAAADFAELQRRIAPLDKTEELPPAMRTHAEARLRALAASTRDQKSAFDPLVTEVRAFVARNAEVDAIVGGNMGRLGPEWKALGAESIALSGACGKALGEWQALSHDLDRVAEGRFPIDLPFLLDLDLSVAIRSWNAIERNATAFPAMAAPLFVQEVTA